MKLITRLGLGGFAATLAACPTGACSQAPIASPTARVVRGGSLTYADARIKAHRATRSWEMFLKGKEGALSAFGPLVDPKFNLAFDYRLQVLCRLSEDNSQRKFVIHFLKPEDEPLARRVGGLMARLYWVGADYLERGPAGREVMDVWLMRGGQAGAEEYGKNIYLHAVEEPRAPAEWVRELAHEYGHATLPPVGRYTDPEIWANGYLGERLYMKWLLVDNRLTDLWSEPIDAAGYVANQIAPLRDRFQNEGPGALPGIEDDRRRSDAAAMDHFIGGVLALEQAYGPEMVRQVLDRFAAGSTRPERLGMNLALVLRERHPARLDLDPRAFIPNQSQPAAGGEAGSPLRFRRAAYWLLLPEGDWRIDLDGTLPDGSSTALQGAPLTRSADAPSGGIALDTRIDEGSAVWRRFELAAPAGQTLEPRGIRISRKPR